MIRRPRGAIRNRIGIASFQQLQSCGAVDHVSGDESTFSSGLRRVGRVLRPFCAGVLVLLAGNPRVVAEQPLTVQVGFGQTFKVGHWTPIVVENVSLEARSCEVLVIDPEGVGMSHPLTRQATDAGRWSGLLRSGRLDGGLEVRVLGAGQETIQHRKLSASRNSKSPSGDFSRSAASTCFPLRQSQPVWLEIGTSSELLKQVSSLHVTRADVFPGSVEIPRALEGVDGIWLTSQVTMTDPVRVELQRWLHRGGHLVVTISTDPEEYQQTAWAGLLRSVVEPRARTRTTDLSGIEGFTVHGRKILAATRAPMPVTTLSLSQGQVLASCLDGPLLTRASLGFGLVTALGLDPTVGPLARWDGRTSFVKRLLLSATDAEASKATVRSSLSQSGITDLASQWRAAAIHIPQIARPTLWDALGLMLLYAVVIGPLDYVLVHKLLKRPQWTWATLPLLVAAASLGTVWLAHAANGGSPPMTQLDVVDIDGERQEVIARSWATAYATRNSLWHVEAAPAQFNSDHSQQKLSWLGFPETASGGMYRDSGFEIGRSVARSIADDSVLDGIPVAQWSSKSLTSESLWISQSPLIESQLTSTVAGELDGPVVHHLPFDLLDWVVVFDKWIYRPRPRAGEEPPPWPAGKAWTPKDERNYGRELRGFLQRAIATKRESKKGAVQEDVLILKERYNPMNLEPADILQMMTLHEAAGGKAYTGLDHHSLRSFDVTPLLSLDRAIVIARVAEPTTAWRINGDSRAATRHHGFIRILLPVRRIGDASGFRFLPKLEPNAPPANKPAANSKNKESVPNETKTP